MKTILQSLVLLSSALLLASCDSSSTSGVGDVGVTLPTPSNGATGTVAKGVISGGTITVTDASGANVPLASGGTTGAGGSYSLVFTKEAIEAGITAPLTVTITGGSSVCDFDADGTDNDCPVGDGTFVAFGESFALPADFTMSGIIATLPPDTATSDPVVTVNVTPASDLAASLAQTSAAGSALTAEEVAAANAEVLGLIQAITGIDMSGQDLVSLPVIDLAALDTSSDAASDAAYGLIAFAAAVVADIDAEAPDVKSVLARLKSEISSTSGNVTGTGTSLSRIANAVSKSLNTVNQKLASRGVSKPGLVNAANNAANNSQIYAALGTGPVTLPPVVIPGGGTGGTPLQLARTFINQLSAVINSAVATTGADGFGGTTQSATEAFATELDSIARLNSYAATAALRQLSGALHSADDYIADGTTDEITVGVLGTMTKSADGKTITITDAVSAYTDEMSGIEVVLTVPTGTRVEVETTGSFSADDVTLVTKDPDGNVIETFTGALAMTFAPEAGDIGVKTFSLTGNIVGSTAGTSFGVDLAATDLAGITSEQSSGSGVTGNYSANFNFDSPTTDALSITFSGAIRATTQSFTVTAGTSTIMGMLTRTGSTDVNVLTNGTVYLTLTLDTDAGTLTSGILTVGSGEAATQVGTLNSSGVITYSDGSIQSLPARIF
ncbi:MAG: hypothetical protein ACFHX7_19620 [Pseudomonadota bacterium]